MAKSTCGLLIVDPWDIEIECCLHLDQPIRLNEAVEVEASLTNHEEVGVEGTLIYELVNTDTGDVVAEIDRHGFRLDSGEAKDYRVTFELHDIGGLDGWVEDNIGDEAPYDTVHLGSQVRTEDEVSLGDEIKGA